jgi:hypothetical protein
VHKKAVLRHGLVGGIHIDVQPCLHTIARNQVSVNSIVSFMHKFVACSLVLPIPGNPSGSSNERRNFVGAVSSHPHVALAHQSEAKEQAIQALLF